MRVCVYLGASLQRTHIDSLSKEEIYIENLWAEKARQGNRHAGTITIPFSGKQWTVVAATTTHTLPGIEEDDDTYFSSNLESRILGVEEG